MNVHRQVVQLLKFVPSSLPQQLSVLDELLKLVDIYQNDLPAKEKEKYFIYNCSKVPGNWVQTTKEIRNPYYGSKMLESGELVSSDPDKKEKNKLEDGKGKGKEKGKK